MAIHITNPIHKLYRNIIKALIGWNLNQANAIVIREIGIAIKIDTR